MKSKTDKTNKAAKSQPAAKSSGKLGDFLGHSIASTIRTMGAAGWTFEQVRTVMTKHKLKPADQTIRIQLKAGRDGKAGAAIEAEKLKAMRPKESAAKEAKTK
jgi:hypothetical protein